MDELSFIWDKDKAESNLQKHGISFEEAKSVFSDRNARFNFDPEHSADEDRLILLGLSYALRLLLLYAIATANPNR